MPKTLTAASVDRLLHHAHVLFTEGTQPWTTAAFWCASPARTRLGSTAVLITDGAGVEPAPPRGDNPCVYRYVPQDREENAAGSHPSGTRSTLYPADSV
jgi:hypothetical protein